MNELNLTLFFAESLLTMKEDPRAFEKYRTAVRNKTPKRQAELLEYEKTSERKAAHKKHNASESGKEALLRYEKSLWGQMKRKERSRSPEKRETDKKYKRSSKGKATESAWNKRQREARTNYSIRVGLSHRVWSALQSSGVKKASSTDSLHGCSVGDFRKYVESKFEPWMNWDNYGKGPGERWELDHIKPCASFDLRDLEQQKQCFHFSNYQPLRASLNRSKGAKWSPVVGGTVVSGMA
jgi:hypothetical protein